MAVIKCKMCGGDLNIAENVTVAECEYCGTKQTVPIVDDEKKIKLYERANKLRINCEFDKAASIYENIVADCEDEAEGYWGLILCRYGIEYVDDPTTGKKVPTCHRSSFDSIMDDSDFEMIMENSDAVSRLVYREEAKYIEEIRKGIIEVSGKEEPYDIFICYKETDENGERTIDSVLAQDVYDALTEKGYRTFFARITLEDKLGVEYEPYIFAALNSAKIMLAFGTSYDYYNAVWVKNEWSRYLKLMAQDKSKHLIPCYKNVDAYDIPKEFAKLQAQDMGKIGAIQDLMRGIDKLLGGGNEKPSSTNVESASFGGFGANGNAFLKRGFMSIEDGEWNKATEFFEQVLNINAEEGQAYWGELLARFESKTAEDLARKLYDTISNLVSNQTLTVDLPSWCLSASDTYLFWGLFGQDDITKMFQRFNYTSKVSCVKGLIEHNLKNFVLDRDRLCQRARQYANATVNAEIEQVKNKLELLLHGLLESVKDEEKEAFEAAKRKSDIYYGRLKNALDFVNDAARINAEKNEEIYRNEYAVWKEERDRFPFLHEQWEKEMVTYKSALEEWETQNGEILRRWQEAKTQYRLEFESLEAKKAELEYEIASIEGLFAAKRIAAKEKELMDVKAKQSRLKAPEQPKKKERPQRPAEPILRAEPTLSLEGKDEVLSIFYSLIRQLKATTITLGEEIAEEIKKFDCVQALEKQHEKVRQLKEKYKVNNYITFGKYEQDLQIKTDIEWLVLEVKGDKAFVISKYALDCKEYNTKRTGVTWETCSLREWLNNDFVNTAFSDDEKAMISTVTVSADKNPNYNTDPGNSTQDKIFLLSITEVNKYFSSYIARQCKPTGYAFSRGAATFPTFNGSCSWWLRSPGSYQGSATAVYYDGVVHVHGEDLNCSVYAVRPAMWIDLNS